MTLRVKFNNDVLVFHDEDVATDDVIDDVIGICLIDTSIRSVDEACAVAIGEIATALIAPLLGAMGLEINAEDVDVFSIDDADAFEVLQDFERVLPLIIVWDGEREFLLVAVQA